MKKIGSKVISLILISIAILFFVLKDNYNEIISVLKNTNNIYILYGFIIVLIGDLFKSLSIFTIVNEEKKDYNYKNAFSLVLQTNFFNGITPFSLGGGPYQIYSLNKNYNIKYRSGAEIVFKDFYSYQMSLVIVSTICLIINKIFNFIEFNNLLKIMIILGYLLNLLVALFLIYLPYTKKNGRDIAKYVITILNKIKLIKDKEKTLKCYDEFIFDFKNNINKTLKNKKNIIKCVLLNVIKITTIGISSYFCFKSLNLNLPLHLCVIFTIITLIIASFIPVPGGSGGMEYGFITLFSFFVSSVKLSAVMIVWRVITYYLPIIIGGCLFALKNRK